MGKLHDFLQKNTINPCKDLPLVHTTAAKSLPMILEEKILKATPCPVFKGEDLLYLFYGKPSYKVSANTPKDWLMPICFLVNMNSLKSIKRVYPFDSGAFKSDRHPDYIRAFNIGEFEVAGAYSPSKIVGAFFKSVKDYFKLRPKDDGDFSSEHGLGNFDYELRALRDLAGDVSLAGIDDRRFCVEIQTADDVPLINGNVEAVIIPYDCLDDDKVRDFIENELGATPLPYECFSLTSAEHTAIIYSKVYDFLQVTGGLDEV